MRSVALVRCVAVAGTAVGVNAQSTGVYFGLNHQALGTASLQTVNGALRVSTPGANGDDGVRIDGLGAEGLRVGLVVPAFAHQANWYRAVARGSGGAQLTSLAIIPGQSEWNIVGDFTALQPDSVRVSLRRDGVLLQSILVSGASIPSGMIRCLLSGSTLINPLRGPCPRVCDPPPCPDPLPPWGAAILPSGLTTGRLGSLASVSFDELDLDLINPRTPPSCPVVMASVDLTTNAAASFDISTVQIGAFGGLWHRSAGAVAWHWSFPPPRLALSGVGSTGVDGVDLLFQGNPYASLPHIFPWLDGVQAVRWEPVVGAPGASMRLTSRGDYNSNPDAVLGSLHVEFTNAGAIIRPNFTSVGAQTVSVEIWNDGARVAGFSGLSSGSVSYPDPESPNGWGGCPWFLRRYCGSVSFGADRAFSVEGMQPVIGDEVRFSPDQTQFQVGEIGSLSVRLEDIAQLRITSETLGVACWTNCDGSTTTPILTVADFGCFLNRFAAGDPRANCDGSTSAPVLTVADFGCFLNRFAAGCQ